MRKYDVIQTLPDGRTNRLAESVSLEHAVQVVGPWALSIVRVAA